MYDIDIVCNGIMNNKKYLTKRHFKMYTLQLISIIIKIDFIVIILFIGSFMNTV